jgi:hypothetical protein
VSEYRQILEFEKDNDMKYDVSKKPTIGATRTLNALYRAMFLRLCEKSFEEIPVQELCDIAMLPRATFYNYFDDKYDLLSYCWTILRSKTDPGVEKHCNSQERLFLLMDNIIDLFEANLATVNRILKCNLPNQYLINDLRIYLTTEMIKICHESPLQHHNKIPEGMAAKLYSYAVLIILEWKFVDKKECSKAQAHEFLELLVNRENLIQG